MKQASDDDIPVVCCLSTAEFRESEATLLRRFRSAVVATEELPDGYAFRLPGDGAWVAVAGELIVAERECCPFLTFELSAHPNKGPLIVRVTGPAGTKEFVRTILCEPEAPI